MEALSKKDLLWELAAKFIIKNKVSCPEATGEDRVYENAPDLVYEMAEIVGYYEYEDDE